MPTAGGKKHHCENVGTNVKHTNNDASMSVARMSAERCHNESGAAAERPLICNSSSVPARQETAVNRMSITQDCCNGSAETPRGPVYSQRLARTSQPVSGGLTVTAVCYTRGLSLVPAQPVQLPHCNPGSTAAAAAAAAACDLFSSY